MLPMGVLLLLLLLLCALSLRASYSLQPVSNANVPYAYCRKTQKHIVPIGRKTQVPVTRVLRRKTAAGFIQRRQGWFVAYESLRLVS